MPRHFRDKPLKYRVLRSKLRNFGVKEDKSRGKGSERILYHPNINGKPKIFTLKCHGEGTELDRNVIKAAREKFNIKIEEFY